MSGQETLFQKVQAALAGHTEREVMQVLLHCLLVVIGVSAPDLDRADAMLDSLPTELKPLLRKEWGNYRQHRARSVDISKLILPFES